jgi:hypothetical protein
MTLPISTWINDDIGLDLWCEPCGRSGYFSPDDARARLDLAADLDVAAFRLSCSRCGAKGPPAISLRFAIGDYYRRCADTVGR